MEAMWTVPEGREKQASSKQVKKASKQVNKRAKRNQNHDNEEGMKKIEEPLLLLLCFSQSRALSLSTHFIARFFSLTQRKKRRWRPISSFTTFAILLCSIDEPSQDKRGGLIILVRYDSYFGKTAETKKNETLLCVCDTNPYPSRPPPTAAPPAATTTRPLPPISNPCGGNGGRPAAFPRRPAQMPPHSVGDDDAEVGAEPLPLVIPSRPPRLTAVGLVRVRFLLPPPAAPPTSGLVLVLVLALLPPEGGTGLAPGPKRRSAAVGQQWALARSAYMQARQTAKMGTR